MTVSTLVEQIAEAEIALEEATLLYEIIPHTFSAIRYIEATERLAFLQEVLESVAIEGLEPEPPRSFNKRKRNRKSAVR